MKDGQKQRNMAGRKMIQSRGNDPRSDKQFFLELEEAILAGYKVCRNTRNDDTCSRNLYGTGQVVLYKDGVEFLGETQDAVPAEETKADQAKEEATQEVDLEELRTKADLLTFAKDNGIEVPEDIKMPQAIKKYLKTKI